MYNDARIIAVSRNVERGILMRIAMLISMRPDGRCHINRISIWWRRRVVPIGEVTN